MNMKKLILFSALVMNLWLIGLGQPVMTNGVIARLDFDGNESQDLEYTVVADPRRSMPQDWWVGYGLEPYGSSRILKPTAQRLNFVAGETVDASRPIYLRTLSAGEFYNLALLDYRALSYDGGHTWQYTMVAPALENESDLLLGVKLVLSTGTHYGWIRFTRPVVDLHTPFELAGYAYHPVPDQPIGAGEPPPPPPLQTSVTDDGQLSFNWDTPWGEVILEWTDNLTAPNWQPTPDGSVPPLVVPLDDGQRFYRLRRP